MPTLPTNPYQGLPWIIRRSASLVLRLLGWQIKGNLDGIPKCVIIAQHTSNWDGIISISGALSLDFVPHWLGKDSLFKGWFGIKGRIMRTAGGISINRSERQAAVAQVIRAFNEHEQLVLFVAPGATRKKTDYWKTGFYYIALGADVPIVPGIYNYDEKYVELKEPINPSGDIEADMEIIRQRFADSRPKYPENAAPIKLAPEKSSDE